MVKRIPNSVITTLAASDVLCVGHSKLLLGCDFLHSQQWVTLVRKSFHRILKLFELLKDQLFNLSWLHLLQAKVNSYGIRLNQSKLWFIPGTWWSYYCTALSSHFVLKVVFPVNKVEEITLFFLKEVLLLISILYLFDLFHSLELLFSSDVCCQLGEVLDSILLWI